MINLLPTKEKREILAGRTNRLLVRYILLLSVVIVMMVLSFAFVWLYLQNTRGVNQEKIEQNTASSQQLLSKQQAIDSFRSDLQTAKTILDKQVNYSTIILRVASIIPDNVVIEQLTLDPATFGTPTSLAANAKTEKDALNLKASLTSSPYFSDAHFDTITRTDNENSDYPYQITMTITLTKELLK